MTLENELKKAQQIADDQAKAVKIKPKPRQRTLSPVKKIVLNPMVRPPVKKEVKPHVLSDEEEVEE